MNWKVFFFTHKALRKQNQILRERNAINEALIQDNDDQYGEGFRDAMALCRNEEKLLHEEIAQLNDLLVNK